MDRGSEARPQVAEHLSKLIYQHISSKALLFVVDGHTWNELKQFSFLLSVINRIYLLFS